MKSLCNPGRCASRVFDTTFKRGFKIPTRARTTLIDSTTHPVANLSLQHHTTGRFRMIRSPHEASVGIELFGMLLRHRFCPIKRNPEMGAAGTTSKAWMLYHRSSSLIVKRSNIPNGKERMKLDAETFKLLAPPRFTIHQRKHVSGLETFVS